MKNLPRNQQANDQGKPLSSQKKFLTNVHKAIKADIGELLVFLEAHPDYVNQFKPTDDMLIESGVELVHKLTRTSNRLLEQLDVIIEGKNKYPVRKDPPRDKGVHTGNMPEVSPDRKTKNSSRRRNRLA